MIHTSEFRFLFMKARPGVLKWCSFAFVGPAHQWLSVAGCFTTLPKYDSSYAAFEEEWQAWSESRLRKSLQCWTI